MFEKGRTPSAGGADGEKIIRFALSSERRDDATNPLSEPRKTEVEACDPQVNIDVTFFYDKSANTRRQDDKVEAAYRRGDLFAKRKALMEAWGGYCMSPPGQRTADVVPMRGRP